MLNKLNALVCRIFGHKWGQYIPNTGNTIAGTQLCIRCVRVMRGIRVHHVTDTLPLKFGSELRKQKLHWAPEVEWWYLYVNGEEMRPLTQFEAELIDTLTSVSNQTILTW